MTSNEPPITHVDEDASRLANVLLYDTLLTWMKDIGLPEDHQVAVETRKARADELARVERIQRG